MAINHAGIMISPKPVCAPLGEPRLAQLLASTILGTILEWYDFSIFAYLAPVMSVLFFPKGDPYVAMLMAYSVFAVGFLIRPIGAAFFGHYGDRFGRKKMLVVSLMVISVTTALIGFLPTYQQAGVLAPVLLIILRLVQGFCIGGESTGATAFMYESCRSQFRGALGSLTWAAVGVGMLLGSLVATLTVHYFNQSMLYSWGWRVPFLLGVLAGVVGYYIRRTMPESLLFRQAEAKACLSASPFLEVMQKNKGDIAKVSSLYALSAIITYLLFVFMPNYASEVLNIPFDQASLVSTIGIGCVTFLVPISGWLSDQVGRKPCLRWSAFGFLLLSYPLYRFMVASPSLGRFALVEGIFVLLAMMYQGVLTAAVQELSATRVRYSVSAIGYNLSYSIFGGTAPLMATFLVHFTGHASAPGLYLAFFALVALISVYTLHETVDQWGVV